MWIEPSAPAASAATSGRHAVHFGVLTFIGSLLFSGMGPDSLSSILSVRSERERSSERRSLGSRVQKNASRSWIQARVRGVRGTQRAIGLPQHRDRALEITAEAADPRRARVHRGSRAQVHHLLVGGGRSLEIPLLEERVPEEPQVLREAAQARERSRDDLGLAAGVGLRPRLTGRRHAPSCRRRGKSCGSLVAGRATAGRRGRDRSAVLRARPVDDRLPVPVRPAL